MRFICSVAFKYLIPKWRQLSVSIISIVSVLVISLVVWLTIVFLSISQGVQDKWVSQLLALHPPVRVTPTDAYYQSYYYKIDALSQAAGYTTQSIGEKRESIAVDAYDPESDAELPFSFPLADRREDGSLKNLVQEMWGSIAAIPGVHPQEFETALGNLRLNLIRDVPGEGIEETCLSQLSYFTHTDPENRRFPQLILPPSAEDLRRLLAALPNQALSSFFEHLSLKEVVTQVQESPFPPSLYPMQGTLKGCGIVQQGALVKVVVPRLREGLVSLQRHYTQLGYAVVESDLHFVKGHLEEIYPYITLEGGIPFQTDLLKTSCENIYSYRDVRLHLSGEVQGMSLQGVAPLRYFDMTRATPSAHSPFWAYQSTIPVDSPLGDGVVISKSYLDNGVRLGDTGYLSYMANTSSSAQEQRLPIYVAGFYDPGLISFGHKCVFVDPKITSSLRGGLSVADSALGNGVNVWLDDFRQAESVAETIRAQLATLGISPYWNVQAYRDYEFVKPILEQLESDQTLFTLIALIILLVACSNIISMLVLLVNDKRKEIGIMLAIGASPRQIAAIFGVCGCLTGLLGSVFGVAMAYLTLTHLTTLVRVLNMIQGHDIFQTAFYGASLPSEISGEAIAIVLTATIFLSLIAGLIPAIKAARVKPTETLGSE